MELKSLSYIVFALITIVGYYAVCHVSKIQKIVLATANTLFILFTSGIKTLVIILIITLSSYILGISIEKLLISSRKHFSRILLWLGLILHISILCYFKFFSNAFVTILNLLQQREYHISSLTMPIGISYFTLTITAYLLDIFHQKHSAEKSFLEYYAFITFFPSIIQGPINLYKKLSPQFKINHLPNEMNILQGAQRCLWGYFKKVVIADRIGIMVNGIMQDQNSAGVIILYAMTLYSFQIYTDFSGGIDVCMGVSEILDIKLTENFKSPFISKSITEYWSRWHISLGEFMEKYLYYPLVLNKHTMKLSKKISNHYIRKIFSAVFASIIVFIIVGIWHGTGWNYVAYGCYQALFVSTAIVFKPAYKKAKLIFHINEHCISWQIFTILRTFIILVIGRFFIRAKNLQQAFYLFQKTFGSLNIHVLFDGGLLNYGLDYKNIYLMYVCIFLIIMVDILHNRGIHFRNILMKQDIIFRFIIYIAALFGIIVFGIYGPEFNSSSFIYQSF